MKATTINPTNNPTTMTSVKNKATELKEIYLLRAIACLSVILVHISAIPVASMETTNPLIYLYLLLNRGAKYTTATFIFISAFVFFHRYQNGPFNTWSFLKKRFMNTLIPYFVWTVVYYFYFIYQGYYSLSLSFFINNLLSANMVYHLYFILTISQFYLLFAGFMWLFKKYNSHVLLALFMVINLLSLRFITMPYSDRFFTTYIFYFAMGCYIAKHYDKIQPLLLGKKVMLLMMYLAITLCEIYLFFSYYKLGNYVNVHLVSLSWFAFSVISVLFLLSLSNSFSHKADHWLVRRISKSSFYIYLSHPLALMLSTVLIDKWGIQSSTLGFIINLVLVYGTTLIGCFTYTLLKEKYLKGIKSSNKATVVTSK